MATLHIDHNTQLAPMLCRPGISWTVQLKHQTARMSSPLVTLGESALSSSLTLRVRDSLLLVIVAEARLESTLRVRDSLRLLDCAGGLAAMQCIRTMQTWNHTHWSYDRRRHNFHLSVWRLQVFSLWIWFLRARSARLHVCKASN